MSDLSNAILSLIFVFVCIFVSNANMKAIQTGSTPTPEDVRYARWAWTFLLMGFVFLLIGMYCLYLAITGAA